MESELTYKLEEKDTGSFLPRWLTGWKVAGDKLNLDQVKARLKENSDAILLGLEQTEKSTILEYKWCPNWSPEQWNEYNRARYRLFNSIPSVEEYTLYRVTPGFEIEFQDRK